MSTHLLLNMQHCRLQSALLVRPEAQNATRESSFEVQVGTITAKTKIKTTHCERLAFANGNGIRFASKHAMTMQRHGGRAGGGGGGGNRDRILIACSSGLSCANSRDCATIRACFNCEILFTSLPSRASFAKSRPARFCFPPPLPQRFEPARHF